MHNSHTGVALLTSRFPHGGRFIGTSPITRRGYCRSQIAKPQSTINPHGRGPHHRFARPFSPSTGPTTLNKCLSSRSAASHKCQLGAKSKGSCRPVPCTASSYIDVHRYASPLECPRQPDSHPRPRRNRDPPLRRVPLRRPPPFPARIIHAFLSVLRVLRG
jgi:hypothetical protein